jgi:hypothetical protein
MRIKLEAAMPYIDSDADSVDLPSPRPWPEPITGEQFERYTPEKFELVQGYLFDGPESEEQRLHLLALLLTNCGLEAAAMMCDADDWREAADRAGHN